MWPRLALRLAALCAWAGVVEGGSILSSNATAVLRSGMVHRQVQFLKPQFVKMLRNDIFMLGQAEAFKRDTSFNPDTPDPPLAAEIDSTCLLYTSPSPRD